MELSEKKVVLMKKKIISDIRLYRSESKNAYGGFITSSFGDKKLNALVKRIVMKLRENEFSLGEFDHLYLNFTACRMPEEMCLSDEVDRYHPWYRYCHIRTEEDRYSELGARETWEEIIRRIGDVLAAFFASEDFDEARIRGCIRQAVEQGEDMLMKFKEKTTVKRKTVIFLRFLDSCRYRPLLRVYDPEGNLLLEKDLPESVTLDALGEIQVSTGRVTIKPRKNALTEKKKPLIFEY